MKGKHIAIENLLELAAQCSTKLSSELESSTLDNADALVNFCGLLSQLLSTWTKEANETRRLFLGRTCVEIAKKILNGTLSSSFSLHSKDADTLFKSLAYPILNVHKLENEVPNMISLLRLCRMLYEDEKLAVWNDLSAKLAGHLMQAAVQCISTDKSKAHTAEILELLSAIFSKDFPRFVEKISSTNAFPPPDWRKLLQYVVECTLHFCLQPHVQESSQAHLIRSSLLEILGKQPVSLSKSLELVHRGISTQPSQANIIVSEIECFYTAFTKSRLDTASTLTELEVLRWLLVVTEISIGHQSGRISLSKDVLEDWWNSVEYIAMHRAPVVKSTACALRTLVLTRSLTEGKLTEGKQTEGKLIEAAELDQPENALVLFELLCKYPSLLIEQIHLPYSPAVLHPSDILGNLAFLCCQAHGQSDPLKFATVGCRSFGQIVQRFTALPCTENFLVVLSEAWKLLCWTGGWCSETVVLYSQLIRAIGHAASSESFSFADNSASRRLITNITCFLTAFCESIESRLQDIREISHSLLAVTLVLATKDSSRNTLMLVAAMRVYEAVARRRHHQENSTLDVKIDDLASKLLAKTSVALSTMQGDPTLELDSETLWLIFESDKTSFLERHVCQLLRKHEPTARTGEILSFLFCGTSAEIRQSAVAGELNNVSAALHKQSGRCSTLALLLAFRVAVLSCECLNPTEGDPVAAHNAVIRAVNLFDEVLQRIQSEEVELSTIVGLFPLLSFDLHRLARRSIADGKLELQDKLFAAIDAFKSSLENSKWVSRVGQRVMLSQLDQAMCELVVQRLLDNRFQSQEDLVDSSGGFRIFAITKPIFHSVQEILQLSLSQKDSLELDEKLDELELHSQQTIALLSRLQGDALMYQPTGELHLPFLRAALANLTSRILLCYGGRHQAAMTWAWQAFALASSQSSSKLDETTDKNGLGAYGEYCQWEALMLVAEIYEQCGQIETGLSYLAETSSRAKKLSFSCEKITELCSLRIWKRIGSDKYTSFLKALQESNQPSESYEIVLEIGKVCEWLENSECQSPLIRHVHKCWTRNPGDDQVLQYNACLSPSIRRHCTSYREASLEAGSRHSDIVISGQLKSTSFPSSVLRDSLNFDVLRDFRRLACLEVMQVDGIGGAPANCMQSFVLGASSISASLECLPKKCSDFQSVELSFDADQALLRGSCDGSLEHLKGLENLLSSAREINPFMSTVFAIRHPISGNLIMGAYDFAHPPMLLHLPVGESLSILLQEWNSLLENSKRLLAQTLDAAAVSKWSERDKKKWWTERMRHDEDIGNILVRLEELLGFWKFLLFSVPSSSQALVETKEFVEALLQKHVLRKEEPVKANRTRKAGKNEGHRRNNSSDEMNQQGLVVWMGKLIEGICTFPEETSDSDALQQLQSVIEIILSHFGCPNTGNAAECAAELVDWCQRRTLPGERTVRKALDFSIAEDTPSPTNGASARENLRAELLEEYSRRKVVELKDILASMGLSTTGKKEVLVERLVAAVSAREDSTKSCIGLKEKSNDDGSSNGESNGDCSVEAQESHLVLMLDEKLQSLPWECIQILRKRNCSRVPGLLSFMRLCRQRSAKDPDSSGQGFDHITRRNSWYVVDPEGNLPATRTCMGDFVKPFAERWQWSGYVGQMPSPEEYKSELSNRDLFVFCGHGAGDRIMDTNKLRRMSNCSAAWLWGCSSGQLQVPGVHDPIGPALNYLLAGSPSLIANLWDVTDKDVDKLSIRCMELVLSSPSDGSEGNRPHARDSDETNPTNEGPPPSVTTLTAKALRESRDVCKTYYAVGCAPVLYGLPIAVT